jgi:Zn-dependent protease
MLHSEPQSTPYDLRFTLFGTPVRVHPLFWLMTLILGYGSSGRDLGFLALWAAAVFASILVHEFGHVLAYRRYGISAEVVLHAFGGLAIPGSGSIWGRQEMRFSRADSESPRARIFISFAGPLAGFAFAAAILGALQVSGHKVSFDQVTIMGIPWPIWEPLGNRIMDAGISYLLFINIFWGLFNLLPVFPLDGGQISRALFTMTLRDSHEGVRQSLWLSIATAVAAGLLLWKLSGAGYNIMLFAMLAVGNYQELQMRQGGWGGRW